MANWQNLSEDIAEEFSSLVTYTPMPGFGLARKYSPEEYRLKVQAGTCAHCSQLARPNRTTCQAHRSKGERGRYARLAEAGLCAAGCGSLPAEGKKRCADCCAVQREHDRAYRNKVRNVSRNRPTVARVTLTFPSLSALAQPVQLPFSVTSHGLTSKVPEDTRVSPSAALPTQTVCRPLSSKGARSKEPGNVRRARGKGE